MAEGVQPERPGADDPGVGDDARSAPERALEQLDDGVLLCDPTGATRWANPAAVALLGWDPAARSPRAWFADLHADDRGSASAALAAAAEHGQGPRDLVLRVPVADGDDRSLLVHVTAGERGGAELAVSLVDVTRWVGTFTELQQRSDRLAAMLHDGTDGTLLLAPDLTIRWLSHSTADMLGWDRDQPLGRSAIEFIYPDDQELASTLVARLAADQPAPPEPPLLRVATPDGRWRWIELSGANLTERPGINALVVHLRDVTERKAALDAAAERERRFTALLAHSNDGIVVLDRNGVITLASEAASRVLGWGVEQIRGFDVRRGAHPDDAPRSTPPSPACWRHRGPPRRASSSGGCTATAAGTGSR